MLATWPMVLGALVAGLIVGVLVPDRASSPQSNVAATTAETAPLKTAADTTTLKTSATSTDGPSRGASADEVPAPVAEQENKPCEQQTWPYVSAACIDHTKNTSQPVRVIPTKRADPATALQSAEKPQQTETPAGDDRATRQTERSADERATGQADRSANAANAAEEPQATEPTKVETNRKPERASRETPKTDAKTEQDAPDREARPRRETEQARRRDRPTRSQARTLVVPEELDEERPRVFIQRDGTRIYVLPDRRHVRRLDDGVWRRW